MIMCNQNFRHSFASGVDWEKNRFYSVIHTDKDLKDYSEATTKYMNRK